MKEWEKMKTVDIRNIKREDLVDITGISKEKAEGGNREMQIRAFVEQVKNPYCFMVGNIIVKSSFVEGVSLKQRLQELADGM